MHTTPEERTMPNRPPRRSRPVAAPTAEQAAAKAAIEAKWAASARDCAALAKANATKVGTPEALRVAGLATTVTAVAAHRGVL